MNTDAVISLPRVALCIVGNAYFAYWAYHAFVPRRWPTEAAPAQSSPRGEGSEYARRRRQAFIVALIAALAFLVASRAWGPDASKAVMESLLAWMALVPSMKLRIALGGLWFLGLLVALVGGLRDASAWLNGGGSQEAQTDPKLGPGLN